MRMPGGKGMGKQFGKQLRNYQQDDDDDDDDDDDSDDDDDDDDEEEEDEEAETARPVIRGGGKHFGGKQFGGKQLQRAAGGGKQLRPS